MDAATVVATQRRPLALHVLAAPALEFVGHVGVPVAAARLVPLLGPGVARRTLGFAAEVERERLVPVVGIPAEELAVGDAEPVAKLQLRREERVGV